MSQRVEIDRDAAVELLRSGCALAGQLNTTAESAMESGSVTLARELQLTIRRWERAMVAASETAGVADAPITGWICRNCGCTDQRPCQPECGWALPDYCNTCAEAKAARDERRLLS